MKLYWLLFLILITGCTTGNVVSDTVVKEGPFKVINVVDGDTLDLSNSERVRLSGINAPETAECYYEEATEELESLVLGKEVYLESDLSDKGKYGRLLRYIYLEDLMINGYLVENGFVKVYDKYDYDTRRYKELKILEGVAKEKNLGVWTCEEFGEGCLYIGSKNSDTYHLPDCKWAKRIKKENLVCYKTEEEVKDLEPCKSCNP